MKMREISRGKYKEACVNNNLFLNPDRVSMPDIDTDYRPDIRDLVVSYTKKRYGENAVCNILTKQRYGMKSAIRAAARIFGDKYATEDEKTKKDKKEESSIRKEYLSLSDKLCKLVPNDIKNFDDVVVLADKTITAYEFLADYCKEDSLDKELEIIESARNIEDLPYSYGCHAAGVIISDNDDVSDYIPLMWDDEYGWKTQCDMVEAEEDGLLKMDYLGLINLNVLTDCARSVFNRLGTRIDFDKINTGDMAVYENIFQKGLTDAVFQFESGGMKKMLKKFKPTCFDDLVILVSLYRPGPIDLIPECIANKENPSKIVYEHELLKPILSSTYGIIVYQEQVMRIFQDLAGYSLGQADLVRRAMGKKKEKVIKAEKESFIHGDTSRNIKGCIANGVPEDVAISLFEKMFKFASYAFNKSHAAAYATVSFYTAWMKHYYPADYMAAVLFYSSTQRLPAILSSASDMGLTIKQPDVNLSENKISVLDDKTIMLGFSNIKQAGVSGIEIIKDRLENGLYSSFKDFVLRRSAKKGAVMSLIKAGAFDSLETGRRKLINAYADLADYAKKKNDKEQVLLEAEKDSRKYRNAINALNTINADVKDYEILEESDNNLEMLKQERIILGAYVSGHPASFYEIPKGTTKISDLSESSFVKVSGIVTDLKITHAKKDGRKLMFFNLEDTSGSIPIKCFTDCSEEIEKSGIFVENDMGLSITGQCRIDSFNDDESNSLCIFAKECEKLSISHKEAKLKVKIFSDIDKYRDLLNRCIDPNGAELKIFETLTGQIKAFNPPLYVVDNLEEIIPEFEIMR